MAGWPERSRIGNDPSTGKLITYSQFQEIRLWVKMLEKEMITLTEYQQAKRMLLGKRTEVIKDRRESP